MSTQILDPIKRLPQQFHELNLVQKVHDLLHKPNEYIGNDISSLYGLLDDPTAIAVDNELGFLAVGSQNGNVSIYGSPGVRYSLDSLPSIVSLNFFTSVGRLLILCGDNTLRVATLDNEIDKWNVTNILKLKLDDAEVMTVMTLKGGEIYVGTNKGNVKQVVSVNFNLYYNADVVNENITKKLTDSLNDDQTKGFSFQSEIVSLEVDSCHKQLLVGFSGGVVAIAHIPEEVVKTEVEEVPATAEKESKTLKDVKQDILTKSKSLMKEVKHVEDIVTSEPCPSEHVARHPIPVICQLFVREQKVMNCSWNHTSDKLSIIVAYDDGSHQSFAVNTCMPEENSVKVHKEDKVETPYGPLPCCSIDQINVVLNEMGELKVFTGGMPKSQFSDCHVVSVVQGQNKHVCFRFGSPVVQFHLINEPVDATADNDDKTMDKVQYLVVLTKKELSVIDLKSNDWTQLSNPYLSCLSLTKVTAIGHVKDVSKDMIKNFMKSNDWLGTSFEDSILSWPFNHGNNVTDLDEFSEGDITALGHENGLISFWLLGKGDSTAFMGIISVQQLFRSDSDMILSAEEESWPPFRKVGICSLLSVFGSCENSVEVLKFIAKEEHMELICGTKLGNIIWWSTKNERNFKADQDCIEVKFNEDSKWLNNDQSIEKLKPHQSELGFSQFMNNSMKPKCLMQVTPVAPITSLELENAWDLLVFGCGFGYALFCTKTFQIVDKGFIPDILTHAPLIEAKKDKSTLKSKGRALKGNLRQSFRKFKSFTQSMTESSAEDQAKKPEPTVEEKEETPKTNGENEEDKTKESTETDAQTSEVKESDKKPAVEEEVKAAETEPEPIAEEVESTPQPLYPLQSAWCVTTVSLANANIEEHVPTQETARQPHPLLLVGTHGGAVYMFDLSPVLCPVGDDHSTPTSIRLVKEMHLHHAAPVLGLYAVDVALGQSVPLLEKQAFLRKEKVEEEATAEKTEEEKAVPSKTKDLVINSHTLLMISKEQTKLYAFPQLKPMYKYKFAEMKSLIQHGAGSSEHKCDTTRHALACSVQTLPCRHGDTNKSVLTLNMSDGAIYVLSVGRLRRLAKIGAHSCGKQMATAHYIGQSVVLRAVGSQVMANEISVFSRLHATTGRKGKQPVQTATASGEATANEASPTHMETNQQGEAPNTDTSKPDNKVTTEVKAEVKEDDLKKEVNEKDDLQKGSLLTNGHGASDLDKADLSMTNGNHDVGDITMDTVRDYLNNSEIDGVVTVKTTESTMVKRTVIRDGDVKTTLREMVKEDGKVLKDDIVKVSSVVQNVE